MKSTKRKRKERRLRILEKSVTKRHAREAGVEAEVRRGLRMAHRGNLVRKYEDAKSDLVRTNDSPDRREKVRKLSFFARLLGRRT